jgi:hypothetical protein
MSDLLPDPSLTRVYRLEATLGQPLDLGDVAQGRRRIVPLTDAVTTLLSALSYRTQSWSMSMPIAGLHW